MNEFSLHSLVELRLEAPAKYVRFANLTGRVIGTAGLTESGVKYRVQFPANGSTRGKYCIVVHSKYLRPITPYEPGFVHAPPCQFPHRPCTCGVM